MAITDDIADDCTQCQPPLSPQCFQQSFTLPVAEHSVYTTGNATADVSSHLLFKHTDVVTDALSPSVDGPFTHQTSSSSVCHQSDSAASPDQCDVSESPVTGCQSHSALSSSTGDPPMDSESVLRALDMGFDYEVVRTVLRLHTVQSAETYTTSSDLVDALLAYTSSVGDVTASLSDVTRYGDVTDERESSGRRQRRVTPSRSCPRQLVGCDVTDDVVTSAAAKKQAGKKKKKKKSGMNTLISSSTSCSSSGTAESRDAKLLLGPFKKLQTTTASDSGCDDEAWRWDVETENKRLKSMKTCKICLEADISVVYVPCGHLVCCDGCASLVSRCGVCETPVRDTVKIYMN